MMLLIAMRRAGRSRKFLGLLLVLSAFGVLLLSGCGGGGGSTNEGFRFVPEGSGPVVPAPNVQFEYDSGSVSNGVIVTAAPVAAAPTPLPPGETGPIAAVNAGGQTQVAAYQINFNTPSVTFATQPRIYLTYAPGLTFTNSTPRIYLYDPVKAQWQILPASPTLPAPAANTLEALLPATLNNGAVLAIFTDGIPPVPTPTQLPTFGGL